jgi:hypothetical protein
VRAGEQAIFGCERTPFAVVLTLNGFCDGLVTLAEDVYNASVEATANDKVLPEMETSEIDKIMYSFPERWQQAAEKGLGGVCELLVNRMLTVVGKTELLLVREAEGSGEE